jgi:F-box-like
MGTIPNANHATRIFNDVLPFEILSNIFLELAHDSSLALRRVLFVSRTWYIAASQCATLWPTIRIDSALHNHFFASGEWRMDAAFYYIQWCLDRSRNLPLHVVFDLSGWRARPRFGSNTLMYRFFPLIKFLMGEERGFGQRVRTLEWLQFRDSFFTSLVARILPQKMPKLQHLTLHRGLTGLWMLPQFPQLQRVELFDYDGAIQMIQEVGRTSVHTLRFGVSECWTLETLNSIACFGNIRKLELFTICQRARSGYGGVIELPYLKQVRTRGEIPFVFWDSLKAPLLIDIELNSYSTAEWLGETNHIRKTQILRFLCPSLSQHKLGASKALQDLIASAFSLETLFIPRSIFQGLAVGGHRLDTSYPGLLIIIE